MNIKFTELYRQLGRLTKAKNLKVLGLFCIMLTSIPLAIGQNQPKQEPLHNPLIGSWALFDGKYLNENKQWVDYKTLNLSAIKLVSATHFSFTTMKKEGGKKTFWASASGHYELINNQYTEFPTLSSFGVKPGESYRFLFMLKENEWHTQRYDGEDLVEEEVWKRLD